MTGLYIHVPFCVRKCPYCDFYSVEYNEDTVEKYVEAVERNIKQYSTEIDTVDTVYFGGGTPSLLSTKQLDRILNAVNKSFKLINPEITLEANPGTVNKTKLKELLNMDINRLSFGVQSAKADELEVLGRIHSFDLAKRTVFDAADLGFDNISCDLMIGTPNQNMKSVEESAKILSSLPIKHISCYMLKIEEETKFNSKAIIDSLPDEDLVCDMYLKMCEIFEDDGFSQYEISNFSKKGFESKHNLKYWKGEDYLGIGPSAHSFLKGTRFEVGRSLSDFINSEQQTVKINEEGVNRLEEYVMLSLRLVDGLEFEKLESLGGNPKKVFDYVKKLIGSDYAKLTENGFRLTPKGFLTSNSIIAEILCR